jgi:hypothetical protein
LGEVAALSYLPDRVLVCQNSSSDDAMVKGFYDIHKGLKDKSCYSECVDNFCLITQLKETVTLCTIIDQEKWKSMNYSDEQIDKFLLSVEKNVKLLGMLLEQPDGNDMVKECVAQAAMHMLSVPGRDIADINGLLEMYKKIVQKIKENPRLQAQGEKVLESMRDLSDGLPIDDEADAKAQAALLFQAKPVDSSSYSKRPKI